MNKRNRKTVYLENKYEYKGVSYPILQGPQGAYVQILNKTLEQLHAAVSIHNRVLVYRFDLHVNYYEKDNQRLSKFINRLKTWISREYSMNHIGYIWVREMEKSKKQHYHVAIFLDGNKIQHPNRIKQYIERTWAVHGHAAYVPKPFYYIDKHNADTKLPETVRRISYLAKVRGKGYRDRQAKDYSASRLNPRLQAMTTTK